MASLTLTNSNKLCFVDDEDYEKLNNFSWYVSKSKPGVFYIKTCMIENGIKIWVYLHRFIVNALPTELVDHKDRDTFNNRRSNLRRCNTSQNNANSKTPKNNTTGFKGVTYCKQTGRFRAKICKNYRTIDLGRFDTVEEAQLAYQKAAKKYFGEFANG